MKKRCLALMLILFCYFGTGSIIWADTIVPNTLEDGRPFEEPFVLQMDGLQIRGGNIELAKEQCPLLINGETLLLPIRVIGEKLGWNVIWDDENQCVILTNSENTFGYDYKETTITIEIGGKNVEAYYGNYLNGMEDEPSYKELELAVVPYLVNGVAMVPQEVFREYMDCSCGYQYIADKRVASLSLIGSSEKLGKIHQ